MARRRKRNGVYYLVFARRENGKLQQKAFSLGTKRKASAERLKVNYGERYALGEIDPFNGWTPKQELEKERRSSSQGTTLEEMGTRFLESRSHVRERTRQGYQQLLDNLIEAMGRTMPVRLIDEQDIRALCFKPNLSPASQTTYLRFCKMFFKWLHDAGHIEKNPCERIKYPKQNRTTSDKISNEAQLHQAFDLLRRTPRQRRDQPNLGESGPASRLPPHHQHQVRSRAGHPDSQSPPALLDGVASERAGSETENGATGPVNMEHQPFSVDGLSPRHLFLHLILDRIKPLPLIIEGTEDD